MQCNMIIENAIIELFPFESAFFLEFHLQKIFLVLKNRHWTLNFNSAVACRTFVCNALLLDLNCLIFSISSNCKLRKCLCLWNWE